MGEIGKSFHQINAVIEDQHADHQSTIVEIEGTISNQKLSILIDLEATLSYITPKMMENCQLTKVRHARPWSIQLATVSKRKVTEFIANCEISIQDHVTRINLNVFPLGSYDMIIGMDWLERYKVVLNCFDKTFTYVVEDKIFREVRGLSKPIYLR